MSHMQQSRTRTPRKVQTSKSVVCHALSGLCLMNVDLRAGHECMLLSREILSQSNHEKSRAAETQTEIDYLRLKGDGTGPHTSRKSKRSLPKVYQCTLCLAASTRVSEASEVRDTSKEFLLHSVERLEWTGHDRARWSKRTLAGGARLPQRAVTTGHVQWTETCEKPLVPRLVRLRLLPRPTPIHPT